MTKRIAIDTTKFKISQPGYDVDTASADHLLVDGFSSLYSGVFTSGSASYDGSWTGGTIGGSYVSRVYKDIAFGRTFSQIPQALVAVRPVGATYFLPRYAFCHNNSGGSKVSQCVGAAVYADKIRLFYDYNFSLGIATSYGAVGSNWEIAYMVFFM